MDLKGTVMQIEKALKQLLTCFKNIQITYNFAVIYPSNLLFW